MTSVDEPICAVADVRRRVLGLLPIERELRLVWRQLVPAPTPMA